MKDIRALIGSERFRGILIGISIGVGALVFFQMGVFVGYHKAAFAYRMGDNYYRVFEHRGGGPLGMPMHDEFAGAHGTFGRIVSVNLPTFIVSGPVVEQTVVVGDDTRVRRFNDSITAADLKVDDFVIVLGAPNDRAQIEAKLIRVMPPPGMGTKTSDSTFIR